ncbi:hypothetical protein H4R99_004414 [Coemansia sp. RSA 1722]|nr:hypothetical protein LPJ57_001488 [Coemansia sp. RSA 486]KAJ2232447.1 hypothetical protein IWW45_004967 [Coemansia sp. RSA 485]KAJ2597685.1 hypothetical protein H4R99_004414 [Coemansia sp. RSA 1722]
MFSSKVNCVATKAIRTAKKVGCKAKSFASFCELEVERARFARQWKVEPYPQTNATSLAFTLDYMDIVALKGHFYNNLYAEQEWPAEELNNFDLLRYGHVNKSCSSKADRYSVNNFYGAKRSEILKVTEMPECNNAVLGQEPFFSNNYGCSADAELVAIDGILTQTYAETDSSYIAEHGYEMGFASVYGSAANSGTGSNPSSEPTFVREYGLKEPETKNPRTVWLIRLCMEYLPVLQKMNAHIGKARTAAGIAHANDRNRNRLKLN